MNRLRGGGADRGHRVHCSITNSRRCSFGHDQRIEVFGSDAMLSVGNQMPTSVRRSDATASEVAPPDFDFFLDRYTPAYRGELDHPSTVSRTA